MSDEQLYNIERKQEYCNVPSQFTLQCSVFDIVDLEYIVPVRFCEDIVEGTFEAKILIDLHIQADHLVEDIRNSFDSFVERASVRLLRVYDNFNHEIK